MKYALLAAVLLVAGSSAATVVAVETAPESRKSRCVCWEITTEQAAGLRR